MLSRLDEALSHPDFKFQFGRKLYSPRILEGRNAEILAVALVNLSHSKPPPRGLVDTLNRVAKVSRGLYH